MKEGGKERFIRKIREETTFHPKISEETTFHPKISEENNFSSQNQGGDNYLFPIYRDIKGEQKIT